MLRRIKRILGFSNNEVAPADASLVSTASSRKSTKSEKKASKKDKKKSPLSDEFSTSVHFPLPTPPADIITGIEESLMCSGSEIGTIVTDSLPYREPSDKIFFGSLPTGEPASSCSTRSLVGSDARKSTDSMVESVISADVTMNFHLSGDAKSRELPVDCGPYAKHVSEHMKAMKKFNAELDGLLKTSTPPFQVSTVRLPPMLRELPTLEDDSLLLSGDEFSDSKNNSVTRILNESHEATTRSPENKHLRSYGY